MEWKYLEHDAFLTRQAIVAWVVRESPNIVEIGGYKNPISEFLTRRHKSVYCIDPLLEEGFDGTPLYRLGKKVADHLYHIREPFQTQMDVLENVTEFALIVLAFDIDQSMLPTFIRLVRRAELCVFEAWADWHRWKDGLAYVVANSSKRPLWSIGTDMSRIDFGNMENSYPPRTNRDFVVLR